MERTVARWLAGTSEPNFAYTLDMAKRAGLLNLDGSALSSRTTAPQDLEGLLEELAANQAEMLENQQQFLAERQVFRRTLNELRAGLDSLLEAAGTSPRRRGTR